MVAERQETRGAPAHLAGSGADRLAGLMQEFADNTPTMIAFWDEAGLCIATNAAHDVFFGHEPGELVGVSHVDFLGREMAELAVPLVAAVTRGERVNFRVPMPDAAGDKRILDITYVPLVSEGGFFVVGNDVTARHTTERTLRQAERIAGLGSWTAEHEDEPWFSPGMHDLIGRPAEEWTPTWREQSQHIHPDDLARVIEVVTASRQATEGYEVDYRLVRPDGEVRWIRARCEIDPGSSGDRPRRIGTELDITELRRTEEELRQAHAGLARLNQTQADLMALLGHDAKQPLTAIRGHLETVEEDWDDLPETLKKQGVARARAAAKRLDALIDEVLTMARIESVEEGEIPTRPRPVRLAEAIPRLVDEAAQPESINTVLTGRPAAYVDPWHLDQVLTNLIGNAVKYGAPPVTITARTIPAAAARADGSAADAGCVEIRVADDGEGVPDSFLPRLFGRFERADEGVATTKRGNGFGLYIVRRLVEANHGQVRYEPGPTSGATFVVTLPSA